MKLHYFFFSMSIWNTMMGTSLLAVPWAIEAAGLFTGIAIVVVMTMIAYYTSLVVIQSWTRHNSKFCFYLTLFLKATVRNQVLYKKK